MSIASDPTLAYSLTHSVLAFKNRVILIEGSVVEAQLGEEIGETKPALVTPTFKREAKRSAGESVSPPSA